MPASPDQRFTIILERHGGEWKAVVTDPPTPTGAYIACIGDGPGDALERVGRELDSREVDRIVGERTTTL